MSTINNGGPAFPHEYKYGDGTAHRNDGMSLRDYFAAKVMAAIITQPEGGLNYEEDTVAVMAYDMANAMLRAREEK